MEFDLYLSGRNFDVFDILASAIAISISFYFYSKKFSNF